MNLRRFFILEAGIFDFLNGDSCSWEVDVMPKLAEAGCLCAFRHQGFWQPIDTLRDRNYLGSPWSNVCVPWKIWQWTWGSAIVILQDLWILV